jgi:hypothetical protein|nr:MAG TPA: hypothetical protein [Caudoviricetes sp.]
MVTLQRSDLVNEYVGRSTDEKPTKGVPNGSTFVEMDTKAIWYFDAEDGEWCFMGNATP